MLTKVQVQNQLSDIPETFTFDELIERLIVIQKIEVGLDQVKSDEVISHIKVAESIQSWSK